jgi:hypothetical protein
LEGRSFVSEDGQWLAVELEKIVTVYDVTGRRSVWCWIAVVGLVALAVGLSWPRKVKLA